MYVIGILEVLVTPARERTMITLKKDSGETEDFQIYNSVIPPDLKLEIKIIHL